jgi:hypothetical protein
MSRFGYRTRLGLIYDDILTPIYDEDAQAFITAAGITDLTQQFATTNLVIGLKTDALWSKFHALYPFVGGTATAHKFNLKNPVDSNAAFRLLFTGGWTHSGTGAQPNGANAYANTFLVPSVVQSLNNNGLGAYMKLNAGGQSDPVIMGSFIGVTQASTLAMSSTAVNSRLNGNLWGTVVAGASGSYDSHKTAAANTVIYKNGTSLSGVYNSGGTLPSVSIYLGTLNLNGTAYSLGYTANELRLAYISEGLNATEAANLYTRVQTFQTTLARQL